MIQLPRMGTLFAVLLVLTGHAVEPQAIPYQLMPYAGDIKVETFEPGIEDENRYTANNRVYTAGRSLSYRYSYTSVAGERRSFDFVDEDFVFVDEDPTKNRIELKVQAGTKPMSDWIPGYNQTVFSYHYAQKEPYEITGLIENRANVWIHPPRSGLFRVLELNPFPSAVFPLEEGRTWFWSVYAGTQWSDERWATYDEQLFIESTYTVTGDDVIEHESLGTLDVARIDAIGKSDIGETRLEALYHLDYGFVRLDYTNIDGSRIRFDLVDVR